MKTIQRAQWSDLIFIAAILFGTFIRFNPTMLAGFAIKQGGMFMVMVDDLRVSHYILPPYTTYNHLDIPFAYPPLGFYAAAFAADVLSTDSLQVLRWLPALFASLSIPAFYWLARRLLGNKYHAAIATLFFALMPRAFSWFITGAGLTRSPGQFFMLLTLAVVVRLYREHRQRDAVWAGIFAGLAVMSHPEAAVHTIASMIFLWIMLGCSRSSFLHSVWVALFALVVSSPWWGTVLHYHGIEPLLNAAQTGQKTAAVLNLLFFDFTEEPFASLIAVLGLIGTGYLLVRREFVLPLWLGIPFLVEGRSAILPAAIPLAMLAAVATIDVFFASFRRHLPEKDRVDRPAAAEKPGNDRLPAGERNVLIYLLLYLLFSAYLFGQQLSSFSLPAAERDAMLWARQNTPPGSRFLVLTGTDSISCDLVLEWFPALSDRNSLYTVQGMEWTKGAEFLPYVTSTYAVQECVSRGDVSCLDDVTSRSAYDYLYVSRSHGQNCSRVDRPNAFAPFLEGMKQTFTPMYETQDVIIFGR